MSEQPHIKNGVERLRHRVEVLDGSPLMTVPPEVIREVLTRLEQAEQAVARVRAVHSTRFYDKWGRDSSEPLGRGGWCSICGRFDGDACRTIRALDGETRG